MRGALPISVSSTADGVPNAPAAPFCAEVYLVVDNFAKSSACGGAIAMKELPV